MMVVLFLIYFQQDWLTLSADLPSMVPQEVLLIFRNPSLDQYIIRVLFPVRHNRNTMLEITHRVKLIVDPVTIQSFNRKVPTTHPSPRGSIRINRLVLIEDYSDLPIIHS
jgi:hypothetical protein